MSTYSSLQRTCTVSGTPFTVHPEDLAFIEKVSPVIGGEKFLLPPPRLCPAERQRRRILWRNERRLYHRTCTLTGKEIISVYSPDKPYPVYDQREWWGDRWAGQSYGRKFDFSRTFFEQFAELMLVVPRVALFNRNSINCDYTNISADNKNCYLLVESSNNEECHYAYWMQLCRDCVDCAFCYQCELCYEVASCLNCYNLRYAADCRDCHDCSFLQSCFGCHDCVGCINLHQKQYHIFNRPYSREKYFEELQRMALDTRQGVVGMQERVRAFFLQQPRKYSEILTSEGCTGCYVSDSRDCFECYHALDARDCRYAVHVWRNARDVMDCDTAGRDVELIYESINNGINDYHNIFCATCWTTHHLMYCDTCSGTHDCFGCVGLRRGEYCILNTQYSKSEYQELLPQIIRHMQETGEWGEFFPASLSCFGYNETVAQDYFPLSRKEAYARGYKWHESESGTRYQGRVAQAPDSIQLAGDDLSSAILRCDQSQKPYKILAQELSFYRKMGIPPPRRAPDQRHTDRMATRTPRALWNRECAKCQATIVTPYAPERAEIVFCGACYEELF